MPCIICDRKESFAPKFSPTASHYRLVMCPDCGLVFQDPQPDDAVLEASYYHDPEFSELLLSEFREHTIKLARQKLWLVRDLGVVRRGARLLDVGCSSGAWIEAASEAGMEATGIEIGERTADDARRRGLDVRTGTFSEVFSDLDSERFDFITFWDVLEHLRDPRDELALAAQLLASDGMLAATFPNVAGWYPRITYKLLTSRTGTWEYPELPVHLYDFSPDTARRLFRRTGYQVRAVRTFATPFEHYRGTTLSIPNLGGGRRAIAIRACYEALRMAVYPVARILDKGNALFVAASVRRFHL